MGYGKVGFGKDEMLSYKQKHNSAVHIDPLFKGFPWWTPYQFAGNNPIRFIDLDGKEKDDPQSTDEPIEEGVPLDELEKGLTEPLPPSPNNEPELPEKPKRPDTDSPDPNNPLKEEFSKEFKEKIADPLEKGIITDFIDKNLEDKEFQKKIAEAQFDIVLKGSKTPGKIAIVSGVAVKVINTTEIDNNGKAIDESIHSAETIYLNPSPAVPSSGDVEKIRNPGLNKLIVAPSKSGDKKLLISVEIIVVSPF